MLYLSKKCIAPCTMCFICSIISCVSMTDKNCIYRQFNIIFYCIRSFWSRLTQWEFSVLQLFLQWQQFCWQHLSIILACYKMKFLVDWSMITTVILFQDIVGIRQCKKKSESENKPHNFGGVFVEELYLYFPNFPKGCYFTCSANIRLAKKIFNLLQKVLLLHNLFVTQTQLLHNIFIRISARFSMIISSHMFGKHGVTVLGVADMNVKICLHTVQETAWCDLSHYLINAFIICMYFSAEC